MAISPWPLPSILAFKAAISMVQPMLCTIVTQVSHEYATDFLQSKEDATLSSEFMGYGMVWFIVVRKDNNVYMIIYV